jgi:quercetin dioxygenase-like cupin family protein
MTEQSISPLISPLAQTATADFLDVMGPLLKPLTALTKADDDYCVFQLIFPHGVAVPLHSHADRETFYMLDGRLEGLTPQGWRSLGPGEVFDVPENARHAWRNFSGSPASLLLVTTLRMGRFLTKLGRPAASTSLGPPTPAELERLTALAADYGYWLGSPEDNAAVGLVLG